MTDTRLIDPTELTQTAFAEMRDHDESMVTEPAEDVPVYDAPTLDPIRASY